MKIYKYLLALILGCSFLITIIAIIYYRFTHPNFTETQLFIKLFGFNVSAVIIGILLIYEIRKASE